MEVAVLSDHMPVRHLEVPESEWFYMNHLTGCPDTAVHDHNFLEIAFILKGKARHFVVQGEDACSAGDVYVIPVGAWHGYSCSKHLEIFNSLLSSTMLERELAWLKHDAGLSQLFGLDKPKGFSRVRKLRLPPSRRRKLRHLLGELENAYRQKQSRIAILGYLLLALDFLRAAYEKGETHDFHETESHPAVREAVDVLCNHIAEDWSLDRLAGHLRLSPSYLVRLFRAHTGVSPIRFLSTIRAERAATLLLSGEMRIGDIGLAVGWPEPKHFAASFQRHFGVSASSYRKKRIQLASRHF